MSFILTLALWVTSTTRAGELIFAEETTEVRFEGFEGEFLFFDYHPRNTKLVLRQRDAATVTWAFDSCEQQEGQGQCTILIEFLALRGTLRQTRDVRTCAELEAAEAAAGLDMDHRDSYAHATCNDLSIRLHKQWSYDRHQYNILHRQLNEKGWDKPNIFAQDLFVGHLRVNFASEMAARDVAIWVGPIDLESAVLRWSEIYGPGSPVQPDDTP